MKMTKLELFEEVKKHIPDIVLIRKPTSNLRLSFLDESLTSLIDITDEHYGDTACGTIDLSKIRHGREDLRDDAQGFEITIPTFSQPDVTNFINELFKYIPYVSVLIITDFEGFEAFPSTIKLLKEIKSIRVSDTGLISLPPEIGEITTLRKCDLHSNKIEKLPDELGRLVNLQYLNLSSNRLTKLPDTLANLHNLELLYLSHNPFKALGGWIGKLKSLRNLYLSALSSEVLTDDLWQPGLKAIDIHNNNLKIFPLKLTNIYGLEWLDIHSNKIADLPLEFGQLKNLNTLHIGNNLLTKLPQEFGDLIMLKDLDLHRNLLEQLPKGMRNFTKLEFLNLIDNKLPIPPEILETHFSPQSILNYYFSLLEQNKRQINEIKILVIGQGSVGKTSIVQRIIGNAFDQNQLKTEGISIDRWQINSESNGGNNSNIKINVWDFGGQEIMHATHQFFLTKRSLYLLVLDSRLTQEENRVEYWLKIIQSFGGESPVLIVGNKIDQHPLDIDRTGLKKKYSNIVGILETSAATGSGIEELKAAITEQVNNLPHVRDLLPETWFTVKTKLEELGKQSNFITHDKYLDLCAENEVSNETSQRTLIGFLHDLGVVLHFQDDRRLAELGILNPQWVTNGVYKILNDKALFANKGILTLPLLDEILSAPEYPKNKRLFIVEMMRKFELCYDIDSDNFLIPDLLPKDEPTIERRENSLAFQYHYPVLPSSIITRFIVRMNEFVDEKVWRTGAVLKDGGNTAVVKADIEDKKVYIWVNGDEHKQHDFLTKIRGQFDAIHKTISKLEVKEMVPVTGHPGAEPVDYDLLLQMDYNNVEVYPVLSGGKMIVVNVREMLNGVARDSDRQNGNTTNIYVGGDVNADTFIAGNENQATVSKSDKKRKQKRP